MSRPPPGPPTLLQKGRWRRGTGPWHLGHRSPRSALRRAHEESSPARNTLAAYRRRKAGGSWNSVLKSIDDCIAFSAWGWRPVRSTAEARTPATPGRGWMDPTVVKLTHCAEGRVAIIQRRPRWRASKRNARQGQRPRGCFAIDPRAAANLGETSRRADARQTRGRRVPKAAEIGAEAGPDRRAGSSNPHRLRGRGWPTGRGVGVGLRQHGHVGGVIAAPGRIRPSATCTGRGSTPPFQTRCGAIEAPPPGKLIPALRGAPSARHPPIRRSSRASIPSSGWPGESPTFRPTRREAQRAGPACHRRRFAARSSRWQYHGGRRQAASPMYVLNPAASSRSGGRASRPRGWFAPPPDAIGRLPRLIGTQPEQSGVANASPPTSTNRTRRTQGCDRRSHAVS